MNIFKRFFRKPLYAAESEFMTVYNMSETEVARHQAVTGFLQNPDNIVQMLPWKYREMTDEEIKNYS